MMKYRLAKALHGLLFLVFSTPCAWLFYNHLGTFSTSLTSRLICMAMSTLIVLQAKWAFIDGWSAVERKWVADQHGPLAALFGQRLPE